MNETAHTPRVNRDRPARNPGGMECQECGHIFIGEEWHALCAICARAAISKATAPTA